MVIMPRNQKSAMAVWIGTLSAWLLKSFRAQRRHSITSIRSLVLPFVMLENDGSNGNPVECVFEGISSTLKLSSDNSSYYVLRQVMLYLSYGDRVCITLDEEGVIVSAERTDEPTDWPLIRVYNIDDKGNKTLFVPGHKYLLNHTNIDQTDPASERLYANASSAMTPSK